MRFSATSVTPAITEQVSTEPTIDLDSVLDSPGLTPGGLSPANNVTTLGKLRAGSSTVKLVCLIEGSHIVLSEAPEASVQAAYAGTDFESATVLQGCFFNLSIEQKISPDDPMPTVGTVRIQQIDTDSTDAFGIYVNKRATGDKTTLTATADRDATTLSVARGSDFAASGDAYVGTERISYTSAGATSLTGVTRGKFSPVGCGSSGSGGQRFSHHHRVSTDIHTTLANPVVSEVPRNWLGKLCSIFLHTWDERTQQLNTRANAQLIWCGRLVGIDDDADSMATGLEVEHIAADFTNGVIGRDLFAGEIADGVQLRAGRKFRFNDIILSSSSASYAVATDLEVVASGASGSYQVNEGRYGGDELIGILNRWLAQAKLDGDINGYYSWAYGVTSNLGLRTKCYHRIEHADSHTTSWSIEMPGEVCAFLGLRSNEDSPLGQSIGIKVDGNTASENTIYQGDCVPYATLIFPPLGPGRAGANYIDTGITYEIENERGEFWDNRDYLPAIIKEATPVLGEVGVFLLDEKVLMVGIFDEDEHTLANCWLAPYQLVANNNADAVPYIGRRLDEVGAPVSIRQVPIVEGPCEDVINWFTFSTGTPGYNHASHDRLPFGLGMPGSLLGPEWERSLANLPGARSPIAIILDEPTKFGELFQADLRLRRAFIRFHDGGFEFGIWRTPLVSLAEHTLTEANKAAPSGSQENHRTPSSETDQWHFPVTKIDYARDHGSSRNATYLKSINIEDQAGSDGSGNAGRSLTLKMRNTFPQSAQTGAAVEELLKEYIVGAPIFSRPARTMVRTIDLRYFETIAVGSIVNTVDNFARDPLTGQRGMTSRAAIVTRKNYDLGGPRSDGSVRPMFGEVELFYGDTQRGGIQAPAAEIDHEVNHSGFSGGYNSTTKQIWLKAARYGIAVTVETKRGPISYTLGHDAGWFAAGDEVIVCECDPADPASPTSWTDTIASIDGDRMTLTTGLAGWSASKQYRLFYAPYTDCQASQQDYVFQADEADEMIQDEEVADQFSATDVSVTFTETSLEDKAELIPTIASGDGKPFDVGVNAAIGWTANAIQDYITAHSSSFLSSSTMGPVDETSAEWATLFYTPIYLGLDTPTATITRALRVAPFFRSSTGATAKIRVAIMSVPPTQSPSELRFLPGEQFRDPVFVDRFAISDEWSTTSTTWASGAIQELSLGVKDYQMGFVYLIVQGQGYVQCRGLSHVSEGPRTRA